MSDNINNDLFDAYMRHQTFIERHSAKLSKDAIKLLGELDEEVKVRIAAHSIAPDQLRRIRTLEAQIAGIRGKAWEDVDKQLTDDMFALVEAEPVFIKGMQQTVSPVVLGSVLPPVEILSSIVTSRPFEGKLLKGWVDTLASADIARINNQVKLGVIAGESTQQIIRRVYGPTGIDGTTKNQLAALVRTATSHTMNEARNEYNKANRELYKHEEYVAVLDGRTSMRCKSLDGNKYAIGEGDFPPQHYGGCRSVRIPFFDVLDLQKRPARPTTEKGLVKQYSDENQLKNRLGNSYSSRDSLPFGHKGKYDVFARDEIRKLAGPVDATETYQTWLGKQSKEFRTDTLGVTKEKLFTNGDLKLDRFVAQDGTELTLSELAVKEKGAFIAAGLDPAEFL